MKNLRGFYRPELGYKRNAAPVDIHALLKQWREAAGSAPAKFATVAAFRDYVTKAPTGDIYEILRAIEARGWVTVSGERTEGSAP